VSEPTLDDVRDAKEAVIRQLKGHRDFAGAGIGRGHDGALVVQVNWRAEPAGITRPERIGKVAVTHHVVGTLKPFAE
jgi:hypothetical protein